MSMSSSIFFSIGSFAFSGLAGCPGDSVTSPASLNMPFTAAKSAAASSAETLSPLARSK